MSDSAHSQSLNAQGGPQHRVSVSLSSVVVQGQNSRLYPTDPVGELQPRFGTLDAWSIYSSQALSNCRHFILFHRHRPRAQPHMVLPSYRHQSTDIFISTRYTPIKSQPGRLTLSKELRVDLEGADVWIHRSCGKGFGAPTHPFLDRISLFAEFLDPDKDAYVGALRNGAKWVLTCSERDQTLGVTLESAAQVGARDPSERLKSIKSYLG